VPTPRWNLVVDVGAATLPAVSENTQDLQTQIDLLRLIEAFMPKNKNSPLALFLPGFTSLRLLLLQQCKSERDNELIRTVITSYISYRQAGRSDPDVVAMTARDFMLLTKQGQQDGGNNLQQIPAASVQVVQPCSEINFNPLSHVNTGHSQCCSSEIIDCNRQNTPSLQCCGALSSDNIVNSGNFNAVPNQFSGHQDIPAAAVGFDQLFYDSAQPTDPLAPHRLLDASNSFFP
jgi:hypothetical protein